MAFEQVNSKVVRVAVGPQSAQRRQGYGAIHYTRIEIQVLEPRGNLLRDCRFAGSCRPVNCDNFRNSHAPLDYA